MPKFDASDPSAGPGWGCTCPAFRFGEPDPEQALAALARSANVTVEATGAARGTRKFVAWTEPENRYNVTYGPGPSGWCKHCVACMVQFLPWHRQLALGADEALETIKRLESEAKKNERKIRRLEKRK